MCRIGQNERCELTGCEWKKVFNQDCLNTEKTKEVQKTQVKLRPLINYIPPESTKPFYTRKRGRVVKEEKKYTEIKHFEKTDKQKIREENNFINKIITPTQDDWIKKIKTI